MALGDKLKGKGQESNESYKNKFKEKLDDNLNNETADPNLDMGYIEGYDKPSYVDRLIQNSDRIQGAKDKINDRLGTEKKLNEGAGVRTKDMPLWEDDEFLFGLENGDIDHFLEDPTDRKSVM